MASQKKDDTPSSDLLEMPGVETKAVVLEAKPITPVEIPKTKESQPKTEPKEPDPEYVFPTQFYASLGVPVCPKCGSKKQTGDQGVICAIGSKQCPLIG